MMYQPYSPDNNRNEASPQKKSPYLTKKAAALLTAFCLIVSCGAGFAGGMAAFGLSGSTGGESESSSAAALNASTQTPSQTDEVSSSSQEESSSSAATQSTAVKPSSQDLSVSEIAALTADAVVEITTEVTSYDSYMRQYVTEGAGSGVIISTDGYIATNNHVIEDASKITVTLRNGSVYDATLIGTDPVNDVAVVRVEASGLTAAALGDSSTLTVGDAAVAIGNPLGQLGGTVTNGIISALDRKIDLDGQQMTLLQTNAAINPGNSGGGLFNSKGELIGIVVAKSSGSDIEGLGFAIPINTAKASIDELIDHGYIKGRIDLGFTTIAVENYQTAFMYGLSGTGVYINGIDKDSNAYQTGFRSGDRIVSFGDTDISSQEDLNAALESYHVGDTVTIVIERSGRKYSGQFTLAEDIPDTAAGN